MDNLQYSRPIDVHRMSEYPEVQRVITFLLSHLKEAVLIKGSPRDKVLRHLKVVVLQRVIPSVKTAPLLPASGLIVPFTRPTI